MLEKDIVAAIMRRLKAEPECFAWKTHGGMYGTAGLPDIVCCLEGRFFAFEVKTPSGQLTKLQEYTLERIQAAGGRAFVVRSVEDVDAVLWRTRESNRNRKEGMEHDHKGVSFTGVPDRPADRQQARAGDVAAGAFG